MKISMSYEISGVEPILAGIEAVKADLMNELADEVDEKPTAIEYAAQDYPPPIPTSNYVRTYNLQRSITHEVTRSDTEVDYTAYSPLNYDQYVHGKADGSYLGAWMHLGRWRTWIDIIAQFGPVTVDRIRQRADKFIKQVFG